MVKLVKESKSVATKYKSSIIDDIDDALTDIFIKYQDELGIESGDVEPFDHLEYTSIMERLADCVVKILDYECGDKITKKSGKSIKKGRDEYEVFAITYDSDYHPVKKFYDKDEAIDFAENLKLEDDNIDYTIIYVNGGKDGQLVSFDNWGS